MTPSPLLCAPPAQRKHSPRLHTYTFPRHASQCKQTCISPGPVGLPRFTYARFLTFFFKRISPTHSYTTLTHA